MQFEHEMDAKQSATNMKGFMKTIFSEWMRLMTSHARNLA